MPKPTQADIDQARKFRRSRCTCPAKGRSKHECIECTAAELASARKDGYSAGLKDLAEYVRVSPSINENTKRIVANEVKLLKESQ